MRASSPALRAAALALLVAGACLAATQGGGPGDPASCLPGAGAVPGWGPDGGIQQYRGDDLFIYIDGGAEIYNEYGFRAVAALDYRDAAGKRVTLEVFEMIDAPAAFGAFTFKASGRGRAVPVGQGADLEDYYLNFWKGRYQVTVTGSDESPESLAGVLAIGRAAADLIPGGGATPDLFQRLPAGFAASSHRKYIKGVIGLYNIHPFFSGDVLRFADAAAAEKGGDWVFLFRYAAGSEAEARFPEIGKALASAGKYGNIALTPDGTLTAVDARGRGTAWRRSGDMIAAALSGTGPKAAEGLLQAFR
jgi:hypothetical protein